MWRLLYGELPAVRMPKLVVLSTGQNDLLSAYLANTRQGEANTLKAVDGIVARWEVLTGRRGVGGRGASGGSGDSHKACQMPACHHISAADFKLQVAAGNHEDDVPSVFHSIFFISIPVPPRRPAAQGDSNY